MACRDGIDALLTEHPHTHSIVSEERQERGMKHVYAARECSKRGQQQTSAVANEAGAANGMAIKRKSGSGMHVARDFGCHATIAGNMREPDAADDKLLAHVAAEFGRNHG